MNKINILSESWCNLVFEGRNQLYGAYQLRKMSHRNTLQALILSVFLVFTGIVVPAILSSVERPLPVIPETVHTICLFDPVRIEVLRSVKSIPMQKQHKKIMNETIPVITDRTNDIDANRKPGNTNTADLMLSDSMEGPGDDLNAEKTIDNAVNDTTVYPPVGLEEKPEFPGGERAMFTFLREKIVYPPIAFNHGNSGSVYISFLIDKNGKVSEIKVLRGVPGEPSFENEAVRVVSMMPDWKPGRQNGREVKVRYTLPVNFQLKKNF